MATAATRLARANLGERVYLLLWERILDRRLSAGQKLSDVHLSEELGVSRTPVREALQRLAQDGILRSEPHRGFYVASFSSRDVDEIYDLRAALEVMALQAAAPRMPTALLERALAELDEVDRLRAAAATDEDWAGAAMAFLATDRWFHHQIVELAGNSRLEAIVKGLWAQIAVFQQAGSYQRDWFGASVVHHRQVIAALLAGDPALAAEGLRRHILEIKVFVRTFSVDLESSEEGRPALCMEETP